MSPLQIGQKVWTLPIWTIQLGFNKCTLSLFKVIWVVKKLRIQKYCKFLYYFLGILSRWGVYSNCGQKIWSIWGSKVSIKFKPDSCFINRVRPYKIYNFISFVFYYFNHFNNIKTLIRLQITKKVMKTFDSSKNVCFRFTFTGKGQKLDSRPSSTVSNRSSSNE